MNRWERERRRATLIEWMIVLGFLTVVTLILVIMVRFIAAPAP